MIDNHRQMALRSSNPRRIEIVADDVLPEFGACGGGDGFSDEECQVASPDGSHKCFDFPVFSGEHEDCHWCECGEEWPVESGAVGAESRYDYVDVSRLGNLRTAEADQPDRNEAPWMREAIGWSINRIEDPSLRQVLLEEYHRGR